MKQIQIDAYIRGIVNGILIGAALFGLLFGEYLIPAIASCFALAFTILDYRWLKRGNK